MMRKIRCELILTVFLMSLVLSGCNRSGEILYFDRETADEGYVQDLEEHTDGLSQKDCSEGEQALRQDTQVEYSRQIFVHVCGQVCQPGVVMLPEGSRAWEAVEAAGGLADEAWEAAVNLAAVLQDGEKLYIPAVGEIVAKEAGQADSGLVNLNTADADRLQTLSGIGESRAADILSYRERSGGFRSVEEIMQVPGIKESTYEKIKDKITVD